MIGQVHQVHNTRETRQSMQCSQHTFCMFVFLFYGLLYRPNTWYQLHSMVAHLNVSHIYLRRYFVHLPCEDQTCKILPCRRSDSSGN